MGYCPTNSGSNNNSQTDNAAVQRATTDHTTAGNNAANTEASNNSSAGSTPNYDNIVKNFSYTVAGRNVQIPERDHRKEWLTILPNLMFPVIGFRMSMKLNSEYKTKMDREIAAAKKLDVLNEDTKSEMITGMSATYNAALNYAASLKQEIAVTEQRISTISDKIANEGSSPQLQNELAHANAQKEYLAGKLGSHEGMTIPIMKVGLEKMQGAGTNKYLPSPELLKVFHDFNPNLFPNMSTTAPLISYLMSEAITDTNPTMGSELNEILQSIGMTNMEETASKVATVEFLSEIIGKDYDKSYQNPDVDKFIENFQTAVTTFPVGPDVPAEALAQRDDMITHQNEIFSHSQDKIEHNDKHASRHKSHDDENNTKGHEAGVSNQREVDEEMFRQAAEAGAQNI